MQDPRFFPSLRRSLVLDPLLAVVVALSLTGHAQEPVQDPLEAAARSTADAPAALEQVAAVREEYDRAMSAFWREYREKPEEERAAFYRERPSAEGYVPRFLELAAAHPGTDAAATAHLWIAQNSEEDETVGQAFDALVADHVDAPVMAQACGLLVRNYRIGEDMLKRIHAASTNPEVQGTACFDLGRHYMTCVDLANTLSRADDGMRRNYVDYLGGEEMVARMAALNPAELQEQAVACFERVLAEYGDVASRRGTLGAAAENNLFQIRHLQTGMVAPEITGEDIFGTEFKLSDYRGKVVVLDFWGHW